jgi:hypothetical protein
MVSESTAVTRARQPGAPVAAARSCAAVARPQARDARRWLQLGLAALWLLDGLLQFQSFMFTRAFGQMLAAGGAGNPAFVAGPVTWSARMIEQHPVPANTAFATLQLLIGLGIACRPALRAALAASIAWSVAVWWLGEGLGGILNGSASPVSGAPGAVILYALLAFLLWPAAETQGRPAPFVAARPAGPAAARALWLLLGGSLAYFAVTMPNRTPQSLHNLVAAQAAGEPGWLGAVDRQVAALLNHHGLAVSVALAVMLAVIAAAVLVPAPLRKAVLTLTLVVCAVFWVAGQNLGGILAGGGTDPDSGPLLMLIALAYWPAAAAVSGAAPEGVLA